VGIGRRPFEGKHIPSESRDQMTQRHDVISHTRREYLQTHISNGKGLKNSF